MTLTAASELFGFPTELKVTVQPGDELAEHIPDVDPAYVFDPEATTAILAGIFFFSVLFEGRLAGETYTEPGEVMHLVAPVGWFLVASSSLELFLAYRLPRLRETDRTVGFDWHEYSRLALLGVWGWWSAGRLDHRCFTHRWPRR